MPQPLPPRALMKEAGRWDTALWLVHVSQADGSPGEAPALPVGCQAASLPKGGFARQASVTERDSEAVWPEARRGQGGGGRDSAGRGAGPGPK